MKELIWLCSSPTPYNDCLFGALHKSKDVDLEVVYREVYLDSYPWKKKELNTYKSRQLSKIFGFDFKLIKQIFFKKGTTFVVGGWHPKFWFVILMWSLTRSKFIVWCDTPNDLLKRSFIKSIVRKFWLALIFKYSFAILGTGKTCVERLIFMGANSDKVYNFPYWVPTKEEVIRSDRKSKKVVKVISVGRLLSVKGFEFMVAAASIVKNTQPLLRVEYVICGDGSIRHSIEDLIQAHGLSEIFTITGWLENDQITEELQDADIYVHPALWEPYGVSVLEAMALGLPILGSSNTMAVIDRVESGVSGLIHEVGDIDMLAEHIIYLAKNETERFRMGAAAYATSRQFPIELAVQKLVEFGKIELE